MCSNWSKITKCIRKRVLKQPSDIRILEQGLHVLDNFLRRPSRHKGNVVCIMNGYVTSTAELLKVRQAGDGRMNGKPKGPVEGVP
jgi:hypothetical protein